MNRNKVDNSQTDSSVIENILATEEELIPSSGFLASVMDRVHEKAHATPPLSFPWKRAVPGIVLAAGVFGGAAFEFVRQGGPAARSITFAPLQIPLAIERPLEQAGWVAMALAVSLVSWLLSRRIAGQSGGL
jgi:hypothetical protein